MKERSLVPIAFFSLTLGLLFLFFDPLYQNIISFLEYFFHKHLDSYFWKIGLERTGVELLLLAANAFLFILFYKKNPKRFILLSCLLWILVFIIYVIKDAVNIPVLDDDYQYFLLFLINYATTRNLAMIFQQEAESRMVIIHLISIILFHLNLFNFKILTFISTACLIGIAFLFYRSVLQKQKALLFFIIVILLFQFQYYNSVFLQSDALYSTCTIFYVFCTLYLLTKHSHCMFVLSLLFALISVLNCGSGFAGLIAGMLLLITQKRTKHLFVWLIFSACISLVFFTNYAFINENIFSSSNILLFLNRSFKCALFSFAFLGGPFQFLYQIILPIIAGAIVWMFFFFLTLKKYYNINPVIYFMLLFLIICSCLPSLLRSDYEIQSAISIRYGVYAIIAICCCIIAYFEMFPAKDTSSIMKYLLITSVFYHLSTNLFFYPEVVIRKERITSFIQNIKHGKPYILPPHTLSRAEIIIKESVQKNIYKFPDE